MTIVSSLICPNCGELYNDSTHRPCIGKCHHSICLSCKNNLKSAKCPICDEAGAFQETVYNHQTVNFLTDFQKSLSEKDFEKVVKDLENLGQGPCSKCGSETKKLRICTDCTPLPTNMSLKTKCLAICANCAVDYHEGHSIVLLIRIPGINGDFEWKSLGALGAIVKNNWEGKERGVGRVLGMYKNTILQHKIGQKLEISGLEISKNMTTGHPIWDAQLKESSEKLEKTTKRLADIRKMVIIVMITRLEEILKMVGDCGCDHESCGNREAVENLKEILMELKNSESEVLSVEDFKKLDEEITERIVQGVQNLSEEPIDKEAIKESYHLKTQLIKDHIRITGIEAEERLDEYQKSCEDFQKTLLDNMKILNDQKSKGLFHMDSGVISIKNTPGYEKVNQELIRIVLKEDEAMMNLLNAHFESSLTCMYILKCFPLIIEDDKVFEYLEEIDKA